MGEYADFAIESIISTPNPSELARGFAEKMKNNLKCKHEIIAEWCAECKRLDTPSIKQVLLQENLEIMENLLKCFQKEQTRTT